MVMIYLIFKFIVVIPIKKVAMLAYCRLGLLALAKFDNIASIIKAIPLITKVRQTVIRRPSFIMPKYPKV